MKKTKKQLLLGATGVLLILAGMIFYQRTTTQTQLAQRIDTTEMTVYKSPTCGCCGGYVSHMRRKGYTIEVVQQDDITDVKNRLGVPKSLESCHTSIIGNYVVEGHVPETVVERLMQEKPDIVGIALPGMPQGSPGMPGPQQEPFIIYAFDAEGVITEFTRI